LSSSSRRAGRCGAIEFNPRPYASPALAIAAGANIPGVWAASALGHTPEPVRARSGVHYRWEDGDLPHLRWQLRHGHVDASRLVLRPHRRVAHPYLRADDPGPFSHASFPPSVGAGRDRHFGCRGCADREAARRRGEATRDVPRSGGPAASEARSRLGLRRPDPATASAGSSSRGVNRGFSGIRGAPRFPDRPRGDRAPDLKDFCSVPMRQVRDRFGRLADRVTNSDRVVADRGVRPCLPSALPMVVAPARIPRVPGAGTSLLASGHPAGASQGTGSVVTSG